MRFKEGLLSSFARLLGLKSVGFVVNLGAKEARNRFGVTWGSCTSLRSGFRFLVLAARI